MSDFLTELRREVVDAHDRHHRRGRAKRRLRRFLTRTWSPRGALGVAAVATTLMIVVIGTRFLAEPQPSHPGIKGILSVGGLPLDAAFSDGSLWVSDANGQVIRVDPATRRVLARIPLGGNGGSIAAAGDRIWVRSSGPSGLTHLIEIDPGSNHLVARVRAGGDSGIAVGAGAVWSINRYPSSPEDISRIGAAGHGAVTRIPFLRGDGIAVHGDVAWAIAHTGTVAAIDARTGRVLRRYPQLAPSDAGANAENVLALDDQGVWALSTENAQIVRILGGRIERRIPLDRPPQPVIARARDGLWIALGNELSGHNRLERIDAETGRVTATVDLGTHRPTALTPADGSLCVVTADGTVIFIAA